MPWTTSLEKEWGNVGKWDFSHEGFLCSPTPGSFRLFPWTQAEKDKVDMDPVLGTRKTAWATDWACVDFKKMHNVRVES